MSTPEFSRPVRVDTLGAGARPLSIGANADERAALAIRFDLQGIEHLSAEAELTLSNGTVRANGTLVARVTQSCVATGAPVSAELTEDFRIEFRPEPGDGRAEEEEVELSPGELDVVFYAGAAAPPPSRYASRSRSPFRGGCLPSRSFSPDSGPLGHSSPSFTTPACASSMSASAQRG